MIIHIPHSSINTGGISSKYLKESVDLMTDWYADELFECPPAQAHIFNHSRLVVDVERFIPDDMEVYGKGHIYKTDVYASPITRDGDIEQELYDKHHLDLGSLVSQYLSLFPVACVVDCHTFNNIPLPWEQEDIRPDICIGTDPIHTPPELTKLVVDHFVSYRLSVGINRPYSGTLMPKWYVGDTDVLGIMIEVNKKLYLDDKYQKNGGFSDVKNIITEGLKIINEFRERAEDGVWKCFRED